MNYNETWQCRNSAGIYRTQATAVPLAELLNLTIDNSTSPLPPFCNSSGGKENIIEKVSRDKRGCDVLRFSPFSHRLYMYIIKPMLLNATGMPTFRSVVLGFFDGFPNTSMLAPSGSGWMLPARAEIKAAFEDGVRELSSEEGTCVPFGVGGGDGTCCNPVAAAEHKAKLMEDGINSVLVVWEHANIRYLPIALGVPADQVPEWASSDYDTIFQLGGCQEHRARERDEREMRERDERER